MKIIRSAFFQVQYRFEERSCRHTNASCHRCNIRTDATAERTDPLKAIGLFSELFFPNKENKGLGRPFMQLSFLGVVSGFRFRLFAFEILLAFFGRSHMFFLYAGDFCNQHGVETFLPFETRMGVGVRRELESWFGIFDCSLCGMPFHYPIGWVDFVRSIEVFRNFDADDRRGLLDVALRHRSVSILNPRGTGGVADLGIGHFQGYRFRLLSQELVWCSAVFERGPGPGRRLLRGYSSALLFVAPG